MKTIKQGAPLDPTIADAVAVGHEGLGHGAGRDALHAPVPADDRHHRREARQLPRRPTGTGGAMAEFSGKELIKGEPDAVVVPLRRPARDLRSPRLHRLGPDLPRLHRRAPQRLDARHPDRLPELDRRSPRQEDARCFARWTPSSSQAHPHPEAVRQQGRRSTSSPPSAPEQEYFLIDKNFYYAPPRPGHHRPHALRRTAAQGPGTGRPVLRRDPRARAGVHGRRWNSSSSSSACRSRPAITKSPPASTRSPRSSR